MPYFFQQKPALKISQLTVLGPANYCGGVFRNLRSITTPAVPSRYPNNHKTVIQRFATASSSIIANAVLQSLGTVY